MNHKKYEHLITNKQLTIDYNKEKSTNITKPNLLLTNHYDNFQMNITDNYMLSNKSKIITNTRNKSNINSNLLMIEDRVVLSKLDDDIYVLEKHNTVSSLLLTES